MRRIGPTGQKSDRKVGGVGGVCVGGCTPRGKGLVAGVPERPPRDVLFGPPGAKFM